jgi:hypothetical protein
MNPELLPTLSIPLRSKHLRPFLFTASLMGLMGGQALAQPFGPIVTIPIEKVRETYSTLNEAGTRKI